MASQKKNIRLHMGILIPTFIDYANGIIKPWHWLWHITKYHQGILYCGMIWIMGNYVWDLFHFLRYIRYSRALSIAKMNQARSNHPYQAGKSLTSLVIPIAPIRTLTSLFTRRCLTRRLPGRCGCDLKSVIFQFIWKIDILGISCECHLTDN